MSNIITEDDLKLEQQIVRCKLGVHEYFREQCIRIDFEALFKKLDPPSLLFQFAHMLAFHKMDWKDALSWVIANKGKILMYADKKIDEWGNVIGQIEQPDSQAN